MTMLANHTPQRRQKGVTLIELLVALMLGLLLTAGMIQVFIGNRATYEFNDSLSRIQENARFTLDHIAYNTRMAGYSGCLSDVVIYNNLDGTNNFRDDIENGIQGHDANGTGDNDTYDPAADPLPGWTPALPAELAGQVLQGSDVLIVRSMGGSSVSLVAPFTNAAQLFVDPSHNFLIGEILVVSDCQKASIFQVTNIDATGVNIVHSNSGSFTPGNAGPNWDAEQDYGLGAELARLQTFAFYVGTGDDGPALFHLRLRSVGNIASFAAEELAGGIETMQVRYGVDNDSDGAMDDVVPASAVADWTRVLSVEVSLLARASEEYGTETDTAVYRLGGTTFNPPDDRRLRQVFSTSVGVRNRLP